jgi:hypothetical protein
MKSRGRGNLSGCFKVENVATRFHSLRQPKGEIFGDGFSARHIRFWNCELDEDPELRRSGPRTGRRE